MKKTAVSLLTAGLLAIGAGAALADGIPTAANIYAPMEDNDWSGFFVSGSLGYGWSDSEHTVVVDPPGPTSFTDSQDIDADGFLGAVGLGYDWTFGRGLVFGVFGDYTFGNLDDKYELFPGASPPTQVKTEYDNIWAVGVRAGYVIHKDMLLYGTVGYTGADVETRLTTGGESAKFSDDIDGYFVGAGLERKLCDNLYLKAEYRFSDYGDSKFHSEDTTCVGTCTVDQRLDNEVHSVRLGVAYKFGARREEAVPLK